MIAERIADGLPYGAFVEMTPALLAEPAEQLRENRSTPSPAQSEILRGGAYRVLPFDFSGLGAVTMYTPQEHASVSR